MRKKPDEHQVVCQICKKSFARHDTLPAQMVRPIVVEVILTEHPDWSIDGSICHHDLNRYRGLQVQRLLETEKGELTDLEHEVVRSLREHELLSENLNVEFERQSSLGEKVADKVAEFGGSWRFIISFGILMVIWISLNSHLLSSEPFDPFPFILLNLMLSCLAAMQAPVIMMSQNRQEAKDRLRNEHEYRVNLKAELEIRHLNSKIDLLITHQWQRLLEIQQVQTDLIEELVEQRGGTGSGDSSIIT